MRGRGYDTEGVAGGERMFVVFFQAEDGIRDLTVTGVQTCALPIFVLFVSAACVAAGALVRRPRAAIAGYAMVVMAIPLVSGRLLAAVGDDRSAAGLARATAAALGQGSASANTTAVLGILA